MHDQPSHCHSYGPTSTSVQQSQDPQHSQYEYRSECAQSRTFNKEQNNAHGICCDSLDNCQD